MTFRWGTVTAVSPLRVRLDGDTSALPFTPDSLVDPLSLLVNDRVRCELSNRRVVIVGRAGGTVSGLREVVRFTSSGTFSKDDYPWLRAARVRVEGGGGAGGGCSATGAGQAADGAGGAGGGYAEDLLLVADIADSVPVTVGAGGAGASGANGGSGGSSSFGSYVSASGGSGGGNGGATSTVFRPSGGFSGSGTAGAVQQQGHDGFNGAVIGGTASRMGRGGAGGGPIGGGQRRNPSGGGVGLGGKFPGGGGTGASIDASASAQPGGNGASGVVVVEMYG